MPVLMVIVVICCEEFFAINFHLLTVQFLAARI